MKIHILGSSSLGNCYLLKASNGETLILEAGIPFDSVKQALNYNIIDINGCLITHCHSDHAKYALDYLKSGIKVYTSSGTINKLSTNVKLQKYIHNFIPVKSKQSFSIGSFKIMPFDTVHDAPEPLGFYIYHPESGYILFITDTEKITYFFDDVQNFIVEANYDEDIIFQKEAEAKLGGKLSNRIKSSHLSFQQLLHYFKNNVITNRIKNIILIHLSNDNSDAKMFVNTLQEQTGKMVWVADSGNIIQL
jgi:phosphoribosyl 1,2-cyclic phosphodiesterase